MNPSEITSSLLHMTEHRRSGPKSEWPERWAEVLPGFADRRLLVTFPLLSCNTFIEQLAEDIRAKSFFSPLNQIAANVPSSDGIAFASALDRVHQTYLRRALRIDYGLDANEIPDQAALRRLALYLEAETFLSSPGEIQHIQDALYVAATIFEYLGQLEAIATDGNQSEKVLSKRLWSGDLANYMRALLLYYRTP